MLFARKLSKVMNMHQHDITSHEGLEQSTIKPLFCMLL